MSLGCIPAVPAALADRGPGKSQGKIKASFKRRERRSGILLHAGDPRRRIEGALPSRRLDMSEGHERGARQSPTRVIALHCSGAGAGQWRGLREMLGAGYELIAPEHYGCESAGPWTGDHAFTLADEAARTIALIDDAYGSVHLVGHSYGGAVALHAALARPDRIASLTLYEPSAFHLLGRIADGAAPFAEIVGVARTTSEGIVRGDFRGAAAFFVDYWGGPGAWSAMRPAAQDALTRWAPKAPLDFTALIEEPTPAAAYAELHCPVLIVRGEHAPAPTRLIAERLPMLLPDARLAVVAGAGHMGPLTHAAEVNALMVGHIAEADAPARRPWRRPVLQKPPLDRGKQRLGRPVSAVA
jgi:pimeloyl-ACP methyl ester carboxylesterase